jgi:hypothetical protein
VDWIGLAQDKYKWRALVNAVMNLRIPLNAGKRSSGYTIDGLSNSSQFHRVSLVGLERDPLSLVSTIEEILERKSSGSGLGSREYSHSDPSH